MNGKYPEDVVSIVYASDDKYVSYMYISIKSLILHTNPEINYQIYILCTDLTERNKRILRQLEQSNIHIDFIDMQKYIEDLTIKGSGHLSVATCYRLFIPELFRRHSKILYIDSDTLILDDVAKMYQISLTGKTVGAVHDVVCTFLTEHYRESIDMDVKDGFNAGILLIDIERFVEKGIKEKCIKLLEEDSQREKRRFFYMDQDVLNLTLQGEVLFMEDGWNFQWQYLWRLYALPTMERQRYIENARHPKIVHYAGNVKPWEDPDLELADAFWEVARNTAYYEEILFTNIDR